MYYIIDEKGQITMSADFRFAEDCIETEKNIVTGFDGKLYFEGEEPVKPEPTYIELRQVAYPPISDQLDMLYWDTINGTTTWKDTISQIKAQYPKS